MCLAIPMQILKIEDCVARCTANGIERDVSLYLIERESAVVGDFVIVHVGYAIQKISVEDAKVVWGMLDAMELQEQSDA